MPVLPVWGPLRVKKISHSCEALAALCRPGPGPCKHHLPNHPKRYHYFQFAHEKLRSPQRWQVTCPRSHSWEAAEPGQTLWASATLERMLVGKPFSTEQASLVQKPQEAFQGSQVGCKSGRAQGPPGSADSRAAEAVCQAQARSRIWCWRAAWCGELLGDAHSSWKTSVGLLEPKEAPCHFIASPIFRQISGWRAGWRGISWDLVL